MKTCLRIPRFLLPEQGTEEWAVPACDRFAADREYWERVAAEVSDAPSALHMILPEVYVGQDDEARVTEIHDNMYTALEQGWVHKLDRGLILTERTTASGTRRGILVCIDLEEFSDEAGANVMVRATEAADPARLAPYAAVRKGAVLEFSHAMVFYRDKKDKLMRSLSEEEFDLLYDFQLMQDGGSLKGYFIPEYVAVDLVQELHRLAAPFFAVADGGCFLAAAKAVWDEKKASLSESERRNHPARFATVEMVNIYDETISFHAVNRLLTGVDGDALTGFFTNALKCERRGNVLVPRVADSAECAKKTDELIAAYLASHEGKVSYTTACDPSDGILIAMPVPDREDIFNLLKKGKRFPRKTFIWGEEQDKRYHLEGREISYD